MESDKLKNDPAVLMRLAKDGDAGAFSLLYKNYFTPVFRYIYIRVKDKDAANDLTQTVFLKVFQSIGSYQEKNKSPLAYFFTIARNAIIDLWRKEKGAKFDDLDENFDSIPDEANNPQKISERSETSEKANRAINRLPDSQQELIILKFINELSNKEIAEVLDKTEDAVRQIQSRALKTLKQYFKEDNII